MFRKAESNVRSVVRTISGGGFGVKPGSKPGAEPAIEYGNPRPAQKPGRKSSWTLIRTT